MNSLAQMIREPKSEQPVPFLPDAEARIAARLQALDVPVVDYAVDLDSYAAFVECAGYRLRYPGYYAGNLPEKSLEHFIAATLLRLGRTDRYIDIASENSPVPEIYRRLFGTACYKQDLSYLPGLHGDTIGSNAADLPVPAGFASKMGLHCSFEHFEGDSDSRFIEECVRVLQPGGAVCIVPLYLSEQYAVMTDPAVSVPASVEFEPDATVHCVPGWGNRHGRSYDPEHFCERVYRYRGDTQLTVYRVTNANAVDSSCYVRFALLLRKPGGAGHWRDRALRLARAIRSRVKRSRTDDTPMELGR